MNNKLFALACTIALAGSIGASAFATPLYPPPSSGDVSTTGDASPILGQDAEVEKSTLGSYNGSDLSKTVVVDKSKTIDITKTDTDIDKSFNTDTDIKGSFNKKDVDITKVEDSNNHIGTGGPVSPAMSDSDIEHSSLQNAQGEYAVNAAQGGNVKDNNFGDNTTKGDASAILGEDAKIIKSDLVDQSSTGGNSPNMQKASMDDSYNTQKTSGELSPVVSKGKIDDSNFVDNNTAHGDASPAMVDSKVIDSNLVGGQDTKGGASPNLVDSEIKNSDLATQSASGSGLNTNLQDGKVIDSNFAYQTTKGEVSPNLQRSNGNDIADQHTSGSYSNNVQDADVTDSMNHVHNIDGQSAVMWDSDPSDSFNTVKDLKDSTALLDSEVNDSQFQYGDNHQDGLINFNGTTGGGDYSIGNVATDNATIFDGDINFGGGSGGYGGDLLPWYGGGGGAHLDEVNINTGVMSSSMMGEESQQANGAGVAVNGGFGEAGGKWDKGGSGSEVSITNNQTSNVNVLGSTK